MCFFKQGIRFIEVIDEEDKKFSSVLVSSLLLVICWRGFIALESFSYTQRIQQLIELDIKKRGDFVAKSITCPSNAGLLFAQSFECEGELSSSETFSIHVQFDSFERVHWQISSSKVLLNLSDLAKHFEEVLKAQTGSQIVVNCGSAYRVNRPGETFKCMVIKQNQSNVLLVKVDSSRNVNWQEIATGEASTFGALVAPNTDNLPESSSKSSRNKN